MDLPRETLIGCLITAALHAREVSQRNHIMPEKILRAGEFVTTLRRQASYHELNKDTVKYIIDKALWSDILELAPRTTSNASTIEFEEIVDIARRRMKGSSAEEIEADLASCEALLRGAQHIVKDAESCTDRAVDVRTDLETLAMDMQES